MSEINKIDRYEIERELGHGGMATVFLAQDPRFDRQVAVKVLPREFLHDKKFRERFDREAKSIAKLEHSTIVPVYDYGEFDGQPFIVMRYMAGGSLKDRMEQGAFSTPEILDIISRIADALQEAHLQGIIHRDIKPGNILFDARGNAYLADFGIAKLNEATAQLTGSALIGTPAYMSPEQVYGDQKIDGRSDVYSLGIILYEMLAGKKPYDADTPAKLVFKHVLDPIPNILEDRADLPDGLKDVTDKALAKDRDDRYDTPIALSSAVSRTLLEGIEIIRESVEKIEEAVIPPKAEVQEKSDVHIAPDVKVPEHPPVDLPPTPPTTTLELTFDALDEETDTSPTSPRQKPARAARFPIWGWMIVGLVLSLGILGAYLGIDSYLDDRAQATKRAESKAEPAERDAEEVAEEKERNTFGNLECTDDIGCVHYESGDPIRIASALVITGPDAQLGLDSQYGVEVAIAMKGEIFGHSIELHAEDDGCSAEGGQAVGNKIVSDPSIVAVVGTSCSGAAVPMSQIISKAGTLMISPSNTAPTLTDPDGSWNPGYYRTSHNDTVQGATMALFAYDVLGLDTAAAIHDGDLYTEGLALAFADAFEALGGTITLVTAVNIGDTDMISVLTSVAADRPEFLFYPVFTQTCALITEQAGDVDGLSNTILAAADGCFSDYAAEALGNAGDGMFFSGPDIYYSGSAYDDFLEMYTKVSGEDSPISVFHAHAFDATNIILSCIEQVAQQDDDGAILIGRQDMRDCVGATNNYAGLTGTLTCDKYGDCGDATIYVYQLVGGNYELYWIP